MEPVQMIVQTKYGKVKGKYDVNSTTLQWLGIPYAKPPVKERRWKVSDPPEKWEGLLNTTEYKDRSAQLVDGKLIGSEDCLYLNIWKPLKQKTVRPVLVFVHGGGNVTGSGEDFNGENLCKATDSVVVTINYRLGAMGFFRHPSIRSGDPATDSGNFAILDILQAFDWVKKNIANFGGDPHNITAAGHSAGARNLLATLISPLNHSLYHKAIILSGGMTNCDPALGEKRSQDIVEQLLVMKKVVNSRQDAKKWLKDNNSTTVYSFLSNLHAKEILSLYSDSPLQMQPFPHLFKDGAVIPTEGVPSKGIPVIPMIIGSTNSEFSSFVTRHAYFSSFVSDRFLRNCKKEEKLFYAATNYGSKLFAAFNAESTATSISKGNHNDSIYVYRFAWGTKNDVISSDLQLLFGAFHGADLDFYSGMVTGLARDAGSNYFNEHNKRGRQKLAYRMRQYLKNFIYTGNPNGEQKRELSLIEWKDWLSSKGILLLDADLKREWISMTTDTLRREEIIVEMEEELDKTDREKLENLFFKERFFW